MTTKQKKQLLKKVWDNISFDEIIDAGFEFNKCSGEDIINAASEFELKNDIHEDFMDALNELFESHRNNLPWTHNIVETVVEYCYQSNVLDYFDNDDLIEHLDGTWEMDRYIKDKCEEAVKEYKEENDLSHDYPTNRDSLIRVIQNMKKDDFRRFLCDLAGLHYCVEDEKLYEELKFKTEL
jgi:hypothetical protein